MPDTRRLALPLAALLLAASGARAAPPNVLVIVADDLGWSDIAPYGSETDTPTLARLAREGVLFSDFYASPMCSPTRAMLMTGVDHHRAGLGNLKERMADNQRGRPGYEGYLAPPSPTLPERLAAAGYRTYMAGKWHLGSTHGADPGSRGFEHYFALHDSGASHFADRMSLSGPEKAVYADSDGPVDALPADFYSTRYYTDRLIRDLTADADDARPFFAYLAYTAPHFPLQAPDDVIDRYAGRYDEGYAAIAAARRQRAAAAGLLPEAARAFPGTGTEPGWGALDGEARRTESRAMEIYAAMIYELDANIGRLLDFLDRQGQLDDTLIVFLSDNGAEGHRLDQGMGPLHDWSRTCCDNSPANLGRPGSYVTLGPNWASVAVTPFRLFKGFTSEGGVRVPAIVRWPGHLPGGRTERSIASVMDVMPTVLEAAGIDYDAAELDGRSLMAGLSGRAAEGGRRIVAWELIGKRALRHGDWKIVRESPFVDWWDMGRLGIRRDAWQLYNVRQDPAELDDRAARDPERLAELVREWTDYAEQNGVILPDAARNY